MGILFFDNTDYANSVINYLTNQTGDPTVDTAILEAAGNNYTNNLTGYVSGLNFIITQFYEISTAIDNDLGYKVLGNLTYSSPTVIFTQSTDSTTYYPGTDPLTSLSPQTGLYVLVSRKQNISATLYLKAGSYVPYLLNYLNGSTSSLITTIEQFLPSINQSDYYLTYNNATVPSSTDDPLFILEYTWTEYTSNSSEYNGSIFTNTSTTSETTSNYANEDTITTSSSPNLTIFVTNRFTRFKSFLYFNTVADAESALTYMTNNRAGNTDVQEILTAWNESLGTEINLVELSDALRIATSITVVSDPDGKCFRCYYSSNLQTITNIYNVINNAAVTEFPVAVNFFSFYDVDPNVTLDPLAPYVAVDFPIDILLTEDYYYIILAKDLGAGGNYAQRVIKSSNIIQYSVRTPSKYMYYADTLSEPSPSDWPSFATQNWITYAFVSLISDVNNQVVTDIVNPIRLKKVPSPTDSPISGDNLTLWVYVPTGETFNLVFVSGPAAAINLEQEVLENTQYPGISVFTNYLPRRQNACALVPSSSVIPTSQADAANIPNIIYYKWNYSLFDTHQDWNIVQNYKPDNYGILQASVFPELPIGTTVQYGYDLSTLINYGFISIILQPTTPVICFLKGALLEVDQGLIPIETVDPLLHTLNGKKIVALTRERNPKAKLVTLRKHIISENVPDRDTAITVWHKVFYKGDYRIAGQVPGFRSIPYNGEILYNILMESLEPMKVNNMLTLSLDPDHPIVKNQNYLQG